MSNRTLDFIRTYNTRHAAPLCSDAAPVQTPASSTPSTPTRRQVAGTALAPRIAMSRPSEAQMTFIKSLLAEITELNAHVGEGLRQTLNDAYFAGSLTPGYGNGASQVIDNLIAERDALRVTHKTQTSQVDRSTRPTLPAGSYAVLAVDDGHTVFYRVEVSERGYYTVSLQISDDFHPLAWIQAQAVIKQIEAAGPLEAAQRYGRELGVCPKCLRTLTNPASIAAGIGPRCASKYGN